MRHDFFNPALINTSNSDSNDVIYWYAFNENEELINIEDIDENYRKEHKFYCIYCHDEMIASLKDDIKRRHFRHKNINVCVFDHYLHTLSEYLFKKAYDSSDSFYLEYNVNYTCDTTNCRYKTDGCQERKLEKYNLKKWYPNCEIEKEVEDKEGNKYIADILLTSNDSRIPPMLIEIFVTHECTEQKRHSGLRIAEIKINSENDIKMLCDSHKISENYMVSLYNFKREKTGAFESELLRYVYCSDKGSYTKNISCREHNMIVDDNSEIELNIIKKNKITNQKIKDYINYRYNLDISIEKSCVSCAHSSKYDGVTNPDDIFCNRNPMQCIKREICEFYEEKGWDDAISMTPYDFDIIKIKGTLPKDYKVLIYGPHTLRNSEIFEKYVYEHLPHVSKGNAIVIIGPLSINSDFSICLFNICSKFKLPLGCFPVKWDKYKRAAGYRCIDEMLPIANEIIAFTNNEDRPTQYLINSAKERNIPLHIMDINKIDGICPKCGRILIPRIGKFGHFIGCSGYPECNYKR